MTRSGAHRDDLGIVGRLEHPGDEHVLSMPLRTPALKGSDLSGPFRHRQLQLLLARDMQHAVIVLDHIANGLQVALDEAGDDLALEAAVFALLDDPLPDDEFQQNSLFAHVAASAIGEVNCRHGPDIAARREDESWRMPITRCARPSGRAPRDSRPGGEAASSAA
jgi:hypothetical protein